MPLIHWLTCSIAGAHKKESHPRMRTASLGGVASSFSAQLASPSCCFSPLPPIVASSSRMGRKRKPDGGPLPTARCEAASPPPSPTP